MFGNVVELKSENDLFINTNKINSNQNIPFYANDNDLYYDSFVPRADKGTSSYLVKKLQDGKYIIFENFDKNKAFGRKYDSITPISGGLVNNNRCYALKVKDNKETYFISPIDLKQTKLDNEIQSIIMTSFISDSYLVFSNAVSDLQFSEFLESKQFFSYKEGLKKDDKPYKISKFTTPPLSNNIDFSHYDSKTCELLAGRFYSLVENYKKTVLNNPEISENNKKRLFEEIFPIWEEHT